MQRRRLHEGAAPVARRVTGSSAIAGNCTGGEQILPALPPRRTKARECVTKGAGAANFTAHVT